MNSDKVYVSVPKIGITEMENPGAESGLPPVLPVIPAFSLFIISSRYFLQQECYIQSIMLDAGKES